MTGHVLGRLAIEKYVRDDLGLDLPPSLSASAANVLLTRSPAHARFAHPRLNPAWESDDSEASDLGTIAHAMLLEGDESRVVIVESKDYKSSAARVTRYDARALGKLPVLAHKLPAIREAVAAARAAIEASELGKEWVAGKVEQTLVWKEDGVWCRCRPDWFARDGRILADLKFTGGCAEPEAWSRGMLLSMGYDLQAAFGLAGARRFFGREDWPAPVFVFVVVETDPPYATSFVSLDPQWLEFAERKRQRAVALWRECMERNDWPGYDTRVQYASPPEYAVYRWGEREALSGRTEGTVEDL